MDWHAGVSAAVDGGFDATHCRISLSASSGIDGCLIQLCWIWREEYDGAKGMVGIKKM